MITGEYNFDGLVGPTHNYAGLSLGNVASASNQGSVSNPKAAAKQGLAKMLSLHELGLPQAVLPPQERPGIEFLKQCGFAGTDKSIIETAAQQAPSLFQAACSASSMWSANAATISPSTDTLDGKLHITPANLINKLHRSIEDTTTLQVLKAIFTDTNLFTIHAPLPHHEALGDEGAANHTRLAPNHLETGLELFVYGRNYFDNTVAKPNHFPARQTMQASQAIIRSHQLKKDSALLIQQNPQVIDQGVFHNDVIAVGNQNVLFYHQQAFLNEADIKSHVKNFFANTPFHFIKVHDDEVSVRDAIQTYLFNSQLLTANDGSMALLLPLECQENQPVWEYLNHLKQADNPINTLIVKDLRQSMANGGGPACLRLRVVLNEHQASAINQHVIVDKNLIEQLDLWVDKHYRDRIDFDSLADPDLLTESRTALDELTNILQLGSIYPFQQ